MEVGCKACYRSHELTRLEHPLEILIHKAQVVLRNPQSDCCSLSRSKLDFLKRTKAPQIWGKGCHEVGNEQKNRFFD